MYILIYNNIIYIYYWLFKYVFTDISMYNTSAFAQNLQKVTRIHQRCSLHVEFMLKFWICWLAPFSRWSTFPSRTLCFFLQRQLFAHMLAHFAHVVHCFYSSRKQASNSSVQHQYTFYCILLEHCCPRNFHPMTSHGTVGWLVMRCSSLLRQARSELRKLKLVQRFLHSIFSGAVQLFTSRM